MNLDDFLELVPQLPAGSLLLPREVVCAVCRYTHNDALPECPTCKDLR